MHCSDNVDRRRLLELWMQGTHARDIARQLGVSRSTIYALKDRLKLPARCQADTGLRRSKIVDPSPDEIAQKCEQIRATWPPERYARYSRPVRFIPS